MKLIRPSILNAESILAISDPFWKSSKKMAEGLLDCDSNTRFFQEVEGPLRRVVHYNVRVSLFEGLNENDAQH